MQRARPTVPVAFLPLHRHSREGGNPEAAAAAVKVVFQGTGRSLLDSRLRGNDKEKNPLPHGRRSVKNRGNDEQELIVCVWTHLSFRQSQ